MSLSSNFPTIKPSLNLDFANVGALDPRITFTRATTATYYDGVTTALAEQNLFTYSQDFDNAAWTGNGVGTKPSVTANSSVAPDGTTTADTLNFTTQYQAIGQGTWVSGVTYTFSVWMKVASGPRDINFTNASGTTLATFTVTSTWTRFIYTGTSGNNVLVALQDRNASGFVSVDIWGAQLEQRSTVTAYTATTTQAITNYIPVLLTAAAGVARFDHTPTTGAALGLLIEEARTNLLTYSAQFDNAAWTKSGASITANAIVSPDGTVTADQLVEAATTAEHRVSQSGSALSVSTAYTISVYAKAAGRNQIQIRLRDTSDFAKAIFNLSTGVVDATYNGSASITSVGNGWYRCVVTGTSPASTSGFIYYIQPAIYPSADPPVYTGNGYSGIFIWGAQLEAGSFATSYIPTVASTVTRNADVASINTLTPWFNAAEGTLFAEGNFTSSTFSVSKGLASLVDNSSNNTSIYAASSSIVRQEILVANVSQTVFNLSYSSSIKAATAYKANDTNAAVNGTTGTTDTSCSIPTNITSLQLGGVYGGTSFQMNGWLQRIAYYPVRLTNAQLQAITS